MSEIAREARTLCSELEQIKRERDEARAEVERLRKELQHIQEQRDQMATTTIREMEGWSADALRTAIAFERVTNAELREHNHQLRVNLHEARAALAGEVSGDVEKEEA